jgi:hypothetical protein
MDRVRAENEVSTSFEELYEEYIADKGQKFGITPHKYWSTGAFPFNVVQTYTDGNGFQRYVAVCPAQTSIEYFSYGLNDDASGAGLAAGVRARISETNLQTKNQTNNEEYAIMSLGWRMRGVRVIYQNVAASAFGGNQPNNFRNLMTVGSNTITDPGSQIVPPEASSALVGENAVWQALKGKVSFQMFWDLKASDYLALAADLPEGGADSYLRATGVPDVHNAFHMKDGWTWRRPDGKRDRLLSIFARCEQDAWLTLTLPPLNQNANAQLGINGLQTLFAEFQLTLNGAGFYYPSDNV